MDLSFNLSFLKTNLNLIQILWDLTYKVSLSYNQNGSHLDDIF